MSGCHIADNIFAEFESELNEYGIVNKVYRVVIDCASNMEAAFKYGASLLGFVAEGSGTSIDDDDDVASLEESQEPATDDSMMQMD